MIRAAVILAGLLLAAHAQAQVASDLRDGRTGEIRFASSSPTGPTALMRGSGPGVEVVGTLSLPPGTARVPAMVVVHGSGGVSAGREHAWARRLNDMGVAAFVTDSFRPRGVATRLPLRWRSRPRASQSSSRATASAPARWS